MKTLIVPVSLGEANAYVEAYHRHTGPMPFPCAKFCCALIAADTGAVLGVAIAGHTSARMLMQRTTLEINRVCTAGAENGCSQLYAACLRAGKALGYSRFITYTLATESGASLRAVGWSKVETQSRVRTWNGERHGNQDLADTYQSGQRIRWEIGTASAPALVWPNDPEDTAQLSLWSESGALAGQS